MLGNPLTRDLDSPCFVTSWPGNPRLLVVVERGSQQVSLWDLDNLDDGSTTIVKIDEAFLTTAPTGEFIGITGVATDIGRLLSIDLHATGYPVTVEAKGLRNPFGFSDDWSGKNLYIVRVDSSVTGASSNGSVWRIDP